MKIFLWVGGFAITAAVLAAETGRSSCPDDPVKLHESIAADRAALEEQPNDPGRQAALGLDLVHLSGAVEWSHPIEAYRAASKGRDLLERVVARTPGNLDAREALYCLYTKAPWPLGSRTRAAAHLAAIHERDPARAQAAAARVAASE
jgi:hypothetical protein